MGNSLHISPFVPSIKYEQLVPLQKWTEEDKASHLGTLSSQIP